MADDDCRRAAGWQGAGLANLASLVNHPMNQPRGHWFCHHCQDMVFLPLPWGRWDNRRAVRCPQCNTNSADWIPVKELPMPPKTVSPETAKSLFQQLHQAVKA